MPVHNEPKLNMYKRNRNRFGAVADIVRYQIHCGKGGSMNKLTKVI